MTTNYEFLQRRLARLALELAARRERELADESLITNPDASELAAQARTMRALGYRRSVGGVWVADRRK